MLRQSKTPCKKCGSYYRNGNNCNKCGSLQPVNESDYVNDKFSKVGHQPKSGWWDKKQRKVIQKK